MTDISEKRLRKSRDGQRNRIAYSKHIADGPFQHRHSHAQQRHGKKHGAATLMKCGTPFASQSNQPFKAA